MSEFKVGDTLSIRVTQYGGSSIYLSRVERISPTGRILLANGMWLNKDLSVRGKTQGAYHRIRRATKEDAMLVEKNHLKAVLQRGGIPWDELTLDELKSIDEIVSNRAHKTREASNV